MQYETVEMIVDDKLIDSNDVQSIIDPLWWSVSIYDGEKQYNKDLEKFSTSQRYVFAIQWYIAEVDNGGHDQFYFNSTGIVWEDAMKGFEAMGLLENYEIIKESAQRMGGYPSKDRTERQNQLDKLESSFDDLDDRFYKIEQNIDGYLLKYIRKNRNDFFFKGKITKPKY